MASRRPILLTSVQTKDLVFPFSLPCQFFFMNLISSSGFWCSICSTLQKISPEPIQCPLELLSEVCVSAFTWERQSCFSFDNFVTQCPQIPYIHSFDLGVRKLTFQDDNVRLGLATILHHTQSLWFFIPHIVLLLFKGWGGDPRPAQPSSFIIWTWNIVGLASAEFIVPCIDRPCLLRTLRE